jgi:FlaA1/EpsC-like NDP-sugar epimerase
MLNKTGMFMRILMLILRKVYSKFPVLAFDILAIPIAWMMAFWLRYNLGSFDAPFEKPTFYQALVTLVFVQVACYYYFKVYRGLWRFTSISDVARILRAVLTGSLIVIPIFYELSLLSIVPRSVIPLYALILIMLLCSARIMRRHFWDKAVCVTAKQERERVLVIGAGQAGESLIRELKRSDGYYPIGLVDDNFSKYGLEVHGVQVLGNIEALPEVVAQYDVHSIFIAIPSASSTEMRNIVEKCEQCQIPFRTLPSLHALVSGRVEVNALRDVRIEDLLGRDQVELEWDKIGLELNGKRILVTGGGGSIGSELCRQIMQLNPLKLLILDNSEFNLYAIDLELKRLYPEIPLELALVSITDRVAIQSLMARFQPEIVFHAAAYKHVPMIEAQIRQGVLNNIIGTRVMAEESAACLVEKFILISTDKAVNPTNVMGATKRVAEIYCQNLNMHVDTQLITVRFGNVLGSVGSVMPLFKQQIKQGGPVTVTHPEMNRYFMTIAEASQLILQAMANGSGGEIFVLDMGDPVNITYLAEQMIHLSGKEPGLDIKIEYIGLRPGEKLFEELFHESEQLVETSHEKLFQARFRKIDWEQLIEAMTLFEAFCESNQTDELRILLNNLVPEFKNPLLLSSTAECEK